MQVFTGSSEHTLDAKLRLAIPAKHRFWGEEAGPAWYCIPLPGGPLRLYTEDSFQKMADTGGSLTPDDDVAEFESTFFGAAERLEMDSAQRLILPKAHLARAGIGAGGSEVMLIGARTRLEVWDKARWETTSDERFSRLPVLMQKIEASRRRDHDGKTS
ncbi:division/cell wall cluster transcriptional repressor MraZ [soil metagenome]